MTYLWFEPEIYGFQVGNATNWAIEVIIELEKSLNWKKLFIFSIRII
jgi:hypothetical protein